MTERRFLSCFVTKDGLRFELLLARAHLIAGRKNVTLDSKKVDARISSAFVNQIRL